MKFGLHRVSIWFNIQKNCHLPRSHSIGENCDANFKLSLYFSQKLCDRRTRNLVCIEYPYGLIYKKNFKFPCATVLEKSAMLISSYHRIFLENCSRKMKVKFGLHRVSIWVNIQKKCQVPRSHAMGEKCDDNL